MAATSDIAKRYFAALAAHDLDEATACWKAGAIDRLVGGQDLVAPAGIRAYFGELFAAFPSAARCRHQGRGTLARLANVRTGATAVNGVSIESALTTSGSSAAASRSGR